MTLDLNRILLYGNTDGTMKNWPKKYFSIVDGIIGMEGNGPLAGQPKAAGIIAAGKNPLAVDMVCTKYLIADFQPDDIVVFTNFHAMEGNIFKKESFLNLNFQPHFGWKGHV